MWLPRSERLPTDAAHAPTDGSGYTQTARGTVRHRSRLREHKEGMIESPNAYVDGGLACEELGDIGE